jgi:hypothetical protein
MLMSFDTTSKLIDGGKLLHIAGAEDLIKKLPKGNWVGGSTEYFMTDGGGVVSGDKLFVTEFPYENFAIKPYTSDNIGSVAADAFESGFSIVILPFDSEVHKTYAQSAAGFKDMFIKCVAGWVAGINLGKPGQMPIAVNGKTGTAHTDMAVALHLETPPDKGVGINIINIFEQDKLAPEIEFTQAGFNAEKCLVNGKEATFADYIRQNGIDTKLPLVGDYSGNGVNISIKSIENGVVNFYAPVFPGIKYRMAKSISDYEQEFNDRFTGHMDADVVFSCNCILNFLYGGLEGKSIKGFSGPITFGEVAYQLVNQTLVYVTVG